MPNPTRPPLTALLLAAALAAGCSVARYGAGGTMAAGAPARSAIVPAVAAHQHLMSPAAMTLLPPTAWLPILALPTEYGLPVFADQLVEQLDDAGIARGVVLSVGYWFGDPRRQIPVAEARTRTRAENDWTVAQVSRYPGRLVAFCGVNPLADYAIEEILRCAAIPQVKGMKVHFGNSGVDVKNPQHVEKLRRFFAAANDQHMAIVAHLRQRGGYTREHASIILDEIFAAAPDVTIQIAHMGSNISEPDEATAVFAEAIAAGDPRTRNFIFDITQTVLPDGSQSAETLAAIAATLRRVGLERIFFGTDMTVGTNPPPRVHWAMIRRLPLTDAELAIVARNVPAYLR